MFIRFDRKYERDGQCRQFPEEAKDASVSECTWTLSALEALRNALYKFKTYLLTYTQTHTQTSHRPRLHSIVRQKVKSRQACMTL